MRRWGAAAVAAGVVVLGVPSAAQADHDDPVTTVATGLGGPRQINDYADDDLVVAESDTGEVSRVDLPGGEVETLLDGLPTPQGVAYDDGLLYVALGEAAPDDQGPPPEDTEPAEDELQGSSVIVAEAGGDVVETYDLLAYELENNPDEQEQFAEDGTPLDALSNPFAVHVQEDRILVADAGANALLAIDRDSGEISTLFVPPLVTPEEVPECAEGNPDGAGCDPVPTGIDEEDGELYLSTLGAEAPGAARVYVLDQDGEEIRRIEDLTGITGLAVHDDGDVYVSELFHGAPEEEPGPDFDPTPVGRVVKVEPDGDRAAAAVTLPSGLEFEGDELYASAWSIAIFLGLEDRGEVVHVDADAFTDLEE